MKRKFLLILFLAVLVTALCGPVSAYTLRDGDSLWVHLDSSAVPPSIVPDEIDFMTLFWPDLGEAGDLVPDNLIYNVYAPVGWTGDPITDPFNTDLSPFQGQDVFFEIMVEYGDPENELSKLAFDETNSSFYFAFYTYLDEIPTLEDIEYSSGIYQFPVTTLLIESDDLTPPDPPSYGDLYYRFEQPLASLYGYLYGSDSFWEPYPDFHSDFAEPVPEPVTLLLLGSGLLGLAGFRRRMK